MKRDDKNVTRKHSPVRCLYAILLLFCMALPGSRLLGYQIDVQPVSISLSTWSGFWIMQDELTGFSPVSIAVGESFWLDIFGGTRVVFDEDDEYTYGSCGYGYPWLDCQYGSCTHAQNHGLDADQCRQENSQYFWYGVDNEDTFLMRISPFFGTTMVVGNISYSFMLLPENHGIALGFHNAFCIHHRNDLGFGRCHAVIRPHHEATQPVNVVRMGSVGNQSASFSTCKVDSYEPGYVSGFQGTDWLSLPIGDENATAEFTAVPYPAVAWPPNTPSWLPMIPVQSSVDPDDRSKITVRTDTAFEGCLRADCGSSFISMGLYVVKVAALKLENDGNSSLNDGGQSQHPGDNWDVDYKVVEKQNRTVRIRAYPYPSLPAEKLPSSPDDGWKLEGPQGNDPLYRILDISTPASTTYTASCGISSKLLTVHVCGVEADGVTSMVRETDAQTGEVTSEYLLLAVPDPANDQMDGTDRRATVALRPLNLLALEGLPLHSWHLMTGGDTGGDGLNHGRLYATCSSGLRFILPGETAEATQAIYDRTEQPCRLLDNLPLGAETTVLVEAFDACTYQRVGHESVTLHYESSVISFTDTLAVTVLDLRTDDIRYLLVNDDNDDMLAYPPDATDEQKLKPFNCVKDKDQQGAVQGEDDLRHISFPFPASKANLPASSLSISVVGNVRLWQDSQRETELVQRVWDADEIAQIYGGLDVWVEGLSPSSSIGDVKLTATWDVAGTPISRTVSLTVLEMRMAVDGGKHLDNINFEDYGSITDIGNFGNYQCAFWPNTDYDILHYENEYFPEPDAWLEDDCPTDKDADGSAVPQNWEDKFIGRKGKKSRTIHHHNGTDTIVYDSPADEDNHCPRDLEDFNRLHMKFDSLFANMDNVEFILSGNGVSINLFPATAPSLSYLKDLTEAEKQSRIQRLFTIGSTSVKLGKENITFGTNGNTVTAFLWEGCPQSGLTSSSGYIQLSVKIGNNLIGTRKVRIVLDDVSNFYDTWESSTIATPSILNGLLANMRGTGAHCLPNANDEYLLVCHGFNVDSIDKEHWPRTIFKRLWWQNYPGRMGFFSWPCVVKSIEGLSPSLYDESDQRAWQNGHHLKSLLAGLKDTGFNVHLLAHSQGNVVAGNALRLLEENKKIATYIASQAAISLSCCSHVSSAYFLLQKCPDVRAEYPLTLSTTDRKPFLDGIEKKADSLFNFFNTVDYALTSAWFIS